jgi:predicted RNase H-like nuclease (RuvC/YqgF family)
MIQNSYIGRYDEMNNKISLLEKEIIELNNKILIKDKDIEILEQELKEVEEMVEGYYRSPEFEEYVTQLEKSMETLNINL